MARLAPLDTPFSGTHFSGTHYRHRWRHALAAQRPGAPARLLGVRLLFVPCPSPVRLLSVFGGPQERGAVPAREPMLAAVPASAGSALSVKIWRLLACEQQHKRDVLRAAQHVRARNRPLPRAKNMSRSGRYRARACLVRGG